MVINTHTCRSSFRSAMRKLIELRYNRSEIDNVAFMVLTATPTKEILDSVYNVVGFTRPENRVLYIRESLDRPNIFFEVREKKNIAVLYYN